MLVELPRPCETGISVVQEPEHVAYGGVTLADVDEIADAAARGEVVERLVVAGPRGVQEEEGRLARCSPGSPSARR